MKNKDFFSLARSLHCILREADGWSHEMKREFEMLATFSPARETAVSLVAATMLTGPVVILFYVLTGWLAAER